jgi:tRNA threonylcarbamoyladenosine biosynthesis protein TsaE
LKERYITYLSEQDKETIQVGQALGSLLEEGDVVALVGVLGSGKTWLTKGLALGLEISSDTVITSPSFALLNEYRGRCLLYHMDAYRLESLQDFLSTGLEECFHEDAVVAMEWADLYPEILPEWRVKVEIQIVNDHARNIVLSGFHTRARAILNSMEGPKGLLRLEEGLRDASTATSDGPTL